MYRELTEFLPQMVFETDVTGKFTFMNRAGFELSGYSPEDLATRIDALQVVYRRIANYLVPV